MDKKKCIGCKKVKSLEDFHKQYNAPDGYRYDCKACHVLYQKKFRRGKGYEREWRHRDWQRYLAMVRQYRRTPGGYYASFKHRKHPVEFDRQEFIDWDSRQDRVCFYCGIPEETMLLLPEFSRKGGTGKLYRLTIDRKDNNRCYSLDNIVLACLRCNETKGVIFSAEEFVEIAQKYIRPKWEKHILNRTKKEKVPQMPPGGMPDY